MNRATNDSVTPRMRPAKSAPTALPTPPMITTTSAFSVKVTPIGTLKVWNMLMRTPLAAQMTPPNAKVKPAHRRTSIPANGAPSGSTAIARIAVPIRVRTSSR